MSLLEYNEIKTGKVIIYNNEPCVVLENHVARTQQRKPQNQTKLKSLMGGRTYNATFQGSDTAEEAEIEKRDIKFLYQNKGEFWFSDPNDPKNRFKLEEKVIGDGVKFLKDNTVVEAMVFGEDEDEQIISIKLPVKMEFTVKDAPPSMKGNTVSGGGKVITLENGTTINAPMFIEAGDKILVNTSTGEYSERL
jgi:elongation factor P